MDCQDFDAFFDQLCEREPEEWFVLHMLQCEECRENFRIMCLIREATKEWAATTETTGEPLDEEAKRWLRWMTGDKPADPGLLQ